MNEISVRTWEEFEDKLRERRGSEEREILFRGQENASWELITTLERAAKRNYSMMQYYRIISAINPEIETLTGSKWEIPEYTEIERIVESKSFRESLFFGKLPASSYMMYLRHHGFPSPLLDWTRSQYIAAYFAFRKTSENDVAIYVFLESPSGKDRSGRLPAIYSFGSYAKSHKRHFLQQSTYTICLKVHKNPDDQRGDWRFAEHEEVYNQERTDQDILWKFVLPARERVKVLRLLETYNLNAFSLFGSEESLMETMAIRELAFCDQSKCFSGSR